MAAQASKCLLLLFFLLSICYSGGLPQKFAPMAQLQSHREEEKRKINLEISKHDVVNPSTTVFPTSPMFPLPPAPTIFTVPTTNPGAIPGTPVTVPGERPILNPVTTYPTNPVSSPVVSSPAFPGQSWCVAKIGTLQTSLQEALDYACGIGGADCSSIQQGGSCFFPNTLENHASFAFNSYFQKTPMATSCDFGGIAMIVNSNPSTGSCIYSLSSSSPSQSSPSSLPATTNPATTPTPTTVFPPPYPVTTSPPYPVTTSPPYPVTTTPPYPVTTTPPYPDTTSPPYPVTISPPYPATISPPYPLTTPPSSGSCSSPTPTVLNTSNPALGSGTTTTTGFGSESPPGSSASSAAASAYCRSKIIGVLLLVISLCLGRAKLS